jgi:hypothetical protein
MRKEGKIEKELWEGKIGAVEGWMRKKQPGGGQGRLFEDLQADTELRLLARLNASPPRPIVRHKSIGCISEQALKMDGERWERVIKLENEWKNEMGEEKQRKLGDRERKLEERKGKNEEWGKIWGEKYGGKFGEKEEEEGKKSEEIDKSDRKSEPEKKNASENGEIEKKTCGKNTGIREYVPNFSKGADYCVSALLRKKRPNKSMVPAFISVTQGKMERPVIRTPAECAIEINDAKAYQKIIRNRLLSADMKKVTK